MARWLTLGKKYQFELQPFHAKPSISLPNTVIPVLLPFTLSQEQNTSETDDFDNIQANS